MVNASFEQGARLFEWLRRYAMQSDERFVYWDDFAFTVDRLPECDAVLIFNNPSERIETCCYPENIIAFMMEPGVYAENPWMFSGLQQYASVYSPLNKSPNTILSHGYLGWHVLSDWVGLSALTVPCKEKNMSCIASKLQQFKGHRLRFSFINMLKKQIPAIDFFGKGSNYIKDKMDGLLSYRYSIAIENTTAPYYFTEKITDCFLAYTIPVYYGCKNIGKFFPEKSFIQVDIQEPLKAIEKVKQVMEYDDWHVRLPALEEARELVLNKYQPLAGATTVLRKTLPSQKSKIVLKPVPDRLLRKIKNLLK